MKVVIAFLALFTIAYGNILQLDGRIVGGKEVDINDFPYQASVLLNDFHCCGGAIIDDNTVLTAAHCVHGMNHSQFSVRVGSNYHNYGQQIHVSQVIENTKYDPRTYDNDLAILKLSTPLNFTPSIQPIALQPEGVELPVGTSAWVSGWGVTKENSRVVSATLRAVDVATIDSSKCSWLYSMGIITERMMCTRTRSHDSCQGDSGEPLVAGGRLVGVVSWGFGCARWEYPGVYAKISNMNRWIVANI